MNLIFESKNGRTIEREEILTKKDLDFNLLDYWWRRREKQRNNFNGKRRQRRKKKLIELTVKVKQSGKRRGGGRKERIWKNKQTVKQEKVRKFINIETVRVEMAEKVGPFGVHSRQNSYPYYQCSFDDRRERILERVFLLSSVISHHSSLFLLGCSGVLAVNHTSCSRSCLAVYLIPRSPLIIIPLSKHLCLYLYVAIDSDRFFRSP